MNEKKDKTLQKVVQHEIKVPDTDLMQLADKIVTVIEMGRQAVSYKYKPNNQVYILECGSSHCGI